RSYPPRSTDRPLCCAHSPPFARTSAHLRFLRSLFVSSIINLSRDEFGAPKPSHHETQIVRTKKSVAQCTAPGCGELTEAIPLWRFRMRRIAFLAAVLLAACSGGANTSSLSLSARNSAATGQPASSTAGAVLTRARIALQ